MSLFHALAYWRLRRHLRAMSERDIHFHFHDLGEIVAPLVQLFTRGFDELKQEIRTMPDRLTTDLAAERAALDDLKAAMGTGLDGVNAKLADLMQQIADLKATGGAPTETQFQELEADTAEISADAKALRDGLTPRAQI